MSEIMMDSISKALISNSLSSSNLVTQKERIVRAAFESDAPQLIDCAKSLLESVMKTIVLDRVSGANVEIDFNPLHKLLRDNLKFSNDSNLDDLLKKISGNFVHNLGEIRNRFGETSHGSDGYFENPIQMPEAEMLARMTDAFAGMLLIKHKQNTMPHKSARLYYEDCNSFNEFFDEHNEPYILYLDGQPIEILASQILFNQDPIAYKDQLSRFHEDLVGYDDSE